MQSFIRVVVDVFGGCGWFSRGRCHIAWGFLLSAWFPVRYVPALGTMLVWGGCRVGPGHKTEVSQGPYYVRVEENVAFFYAEDDGVAQVYG